MRRDPSYGASVLEQAAAIWRQDRESYPEWLICPASRRQELLFGTMNVPITHEVIDAVPEERRDAIVYEIFWRYRTSFGRISDQLAELFAKFADPTAASGLLKQRRCEIAALLLRRARRAADDEAFGRWATIIEAQCEPHTDLRAELAYQKALYARDRLDFSAAAAAAATIEGVDPAWPSKQAALLAELGEFEKAYKLVTDAVAELNRRQSKDRSSLWLRSRRAWVEWLARAVRRDEPNGGEEPRWTSEFRDAHCDPEVETGWITDEAAAQVRKRLEQSKPTIPLFQAGHYQEAAQTVHLQSAMVVEPLEALDSVMETAGLPMRLHHGTFVRNAARDAAELAFEPSFQWYIWFLRAIGSPFDPLFGRYLGRVSIAQIPTEVVIALSEAVRAAIGYWRGKAKDTSSPHRAFMIEQLRFLVEVLARITIRQAPLAASASLDLASDLVRDASIRHPWLRDPLSHLVDYSIEAIPPAERSAAVLPMLEFPFSDDGGTLPFQWPNPIQSLWTTKPSRVMSDPRWSRCVAHLIEHAKAGIPQRPEAIGRLAYLSRHDVLTPDETKAFGEALWSETDAASGGLPANANLLASMFAQLPAPATIDREKLAFVDKG